MAIARLEPDALRRRCDTRRLPFATTAELGAQTIVLGQARAASAIEFGIGIPHRGYNLFVLGPSGTGRRTLIADILHREAARRPTPHDWCYVNNFSDPQRPIALGLPTGRAAALRHHMEGWVEALKSGIPAAFQSEEFRVRSERIESELAEWQRAAFEDLGKRAAADNLAIVRTPSGFSIAPVARGEVIGPDEYEKLPAEERKTIEEAVERHQAELERTLREVSQRHRESTERLRALAREIVELAVRTATTELRAAYADLPEVASYIDAARNDVIQRADEFRKPAEGSMEIAGGVIVRGQADYRRYRVNVIVETGGRSGAPVVFEDNPGYSNLIGRVEHLSQFGTLVTDFDLIRPGALHRANGGYLVLDAAKILGEPFAWSALKRVLSTHEIRLESLGHALSLVSTLSLEPHPIPLDAKVVLFGPRHLFYLLEALDPDFPALFRVAAELEDEMDWNADNVLAIAGIVGALCVRRELLPFDRDAVAAVVERCARLADDCEKLSVHMQSIEEVVLESDHFARHAGQAAVARGDVEQAVSEQVRRASRVQEKVQEAIRRDILVIDTTGRVVGQVNGLALFALGRTWVAQPQRITATTRLGGGEFIDIQREVALGGAIHSKGVLTLGAFVATRFARLRPMSVSASLAFEQTYGSVDGDSASAAELCALLSSLADVPIRQDLAITGAVNQRGEVQAVGGVNDKIEGFFDLCYARGLTGDQGVIIPAANRQHLMLRSGVVDAAAAGRFHIYTVGHVDEAMELLTGVAAGAEDVTGNFPLDSVNGRVAERLAHLASIAMARERAIRREANGARRDRR